jgi:hypothetical protein
LSRQRTIPFELDKSKEAHLESLESGKPDERLLGKSAIEDSSDLEFGSVVVNRLTKVGKSGGGVTTEGGVADEGGEEVADEGETGESGVGACGRRGS